MPLPKPPGLDGWHSQIIVRWMSRLHIWLYRKTGGRWGASFRGVPVLLLMTIGRRSGIPRTKPLIYLSDGETRVVVASKAGMKHHPLWFRNLEANPSVEVEVGGVRTHMMARVAAAEERAALWPRLVAVYADYESYQSWAVREIPVVVLEPSDSA